jgi:hypothetical protein
MKSESPAQLTFNGPKICVGSESPVWRRCAAALDGMVKVRNGPVMIIEIGRIPDILRECQFYWTKLSKLTFSRIDH